MKHEFKEGQWFDIRKLTDWQKQWCLDNLDFLPTSEVDFERRDFNLWLYSEWTNLGYIFGSASDHCCEPENEITFNDFYWGEDEEVSQESVFDRPKYVTFNAVADVMGCFLDILIDGKDYKISSVKTTRHGKTYTLENGIRAHESFFHKVTPQDLLPEECVDEKASFDNLVYVEPKSNDKYYTLSKSQMSQEQWNFSINNIPMEKDNFEVCEYLNLNPYNNLWFYQDTLSGSQDIYISFNDIFKEVN